MPHLPPRFLKLSRPLVFLAVAGLVSCSQRADPLGPLLQPGGGLLSIQTEKRTYPQAEASVASGIGIRASLINLTDRTFHATLGDAFNPAPEQPVLNVAEG